MWRTLHLILPALIPSWRFFDGIAPSPRIEVNWQVSKGQPDWQEFRARPQHLPLKTILGRLFYNPGWNETLYLVTCAEQLSETSDPFFQTQILTRILANPPQEPNKTCVQFRLVFVSREETQLRRDIIYQSPSFDRSGEVL